MIFGDYCYFCEVGAEGAQTNLGCSGDELSRRLPYTDKTGFYQGSYHPVDNYVYWCGLCEPGLIYQYKEISTLDMLKSIESDFRYLVYSPIYAFINNPEGKDLPQDTPVSHSNKLHAYDTSMSMLRELKRRYV